MSSHTRFDFLTAPAYARCPNTAIRGWECLGWRIVLLWGGHHWLSPCWILPTWRIRLGHGSNLPQKNVVRFLVQASNQASKHACMQLAAAYNWDSLEAPQHKAMKLLPPPSSSSSSSATPTRETKQRHQTHTHTPQQQQQQQREAHSSTIVGTRQCGTGNAAPPASDSLTLAFFFFFFFFYKFKFKF
jgi:hypothetical protein